MVCLVSPFSLFSTGCIFRISQVGDSASPGFYCTIIADCGGSGTVVS